MLEALFLKYVTCLRVVCYIYLCAVTTMQSKTTLIMIAIAWYADVWVNGLVFQGLGLKILELRASRAGSGSFDSFNRDKAGPYTLNPRPCTSFGQTFRVGLGLPLPLGSVWFRS